MCPNLEHATLNIYHFIFPGLAKVLVTQARNKYFGKICHVKFKKKKEEFLLAKFGEIVQCTQHIDDR